MPQFEFANFAPQMIWLAGIFFALYFLIVKTTLPKVARVVDDRTAKIDADLSAAAAARDAAAAANTGFDHVLTEARSSAAAHVNTAKAEAGRTTDIKVKAVDATLALKIADAETRISELRTKALHDVNSVAAQAASDIVAKLTGVGVSADAANAAVSALKA
jgi:F-type H+-transporting ATPase subunit b